MKIVVSCFNSKTRKTIVMLFMHGLLAGNLNSHINLVPPTLLRLLIQGGYTWQAFIQTFLVAHKPNFKLFTWRFFRRNKSWIIWTRDILAKQVKCTQKRRKTEIWGNSEAKFFPGICSSKVAYYSLEPFQCWPLAKHWHPLSRLSSTSPNVRWKYQLKEALI